MRKDEFGLLLNFDNGQYAGNMEFIPPQQKKKLYSMMKVVNENEKYRFIEPIKCKVKYHNLTKKGLLRIPSFVEFA